MKLVPEKSVEFGLANEKLANSNTSETKSTNTDAIDCYNECSIKFGHANVGVHFGII